MKEKVILFDGTNLDAFYDQETKGEPTWEVKDGKMTVVKNDIISKEQFGDAHIHVEFNLPYMPDAHGQLRANSGIYVQGEYEIQILDSYGQENPTSNDCGGVYELSAPIANACKAPLEWQTYDIFFRTARFNEDGSVAENAIMTVLLNGQVIQNGLVLPGPTPGGLTNTIVARGPIRLQDHWHPVSFRNVWVQPLD